MKPEIETMIGPLPPRDRASHYLPDVEVIHYGVFQAWLDKRTEGALVIDVTETSRALMFAPQEIDNRVRLSEVIDKFRDSSFSERCEMADRLEKFGIAP